jgi:large subunit ribosomal protein L25
MTISLDVAPRATNQSTKAVRQSGLIPAVVYGPKQPSVAVTIEKKAFDSLFKTAGESTIIMLKGLPNPVEVLVHDVDFSPTKGGIMHVDFYAVEAGKEITTHVALEFIGESPAEKTGAMVSKIMHEVEVTCMPNVLPSHIDVDISMLTEVDQKIHISDLKLPKGVTVENDAHDVIALVAEGGDDGDSEAAEVTEAPAAA